ncbi:LysR family transcriptional regulator [Caballeronia grimmiae]|uniref:LysR family transcriptional regulator n=1 Tax=Caballeronia grimmiae TaxID=1071679 RepID=UPI0038BD21EB
MNRVKAMRVFVRVAETGSFRGTARGLGVSNALVSRAVASLEAHLHKRLIDRNSREVSLTDAGARYFEGCRALLEQLDRLESTVTSGQARVSGTLRVVASSALPPLFLTRLIDEFRKLYPGVTVRATLAEGPVDFVERRYDVGIVMGVRDSAGLTMQPAAASMPVAVASPAFLAEHGVPSAPVELHRLPFIGLRTERCNERWHFRGMQGAIEPTVLTPVYSVNSGLLVRLALQSNVGFSILPIKMVQTDLEGGALVQLLPDYFVDGSRMIFSVVHLARKYPPREVRVFAEFAHAYLSQQLAATTESCNCNDLPALSQPPSVPNADGVLASAG